MYKNQINGSLRNSIGLPFSLSRLQSGGGLYHPTLNPYAPNPNRKLPNYVPPTREQLSIINPNTTPLAKPLPTTLGYKEKRAFVGPWKERTKQQLEQERIWKEKYVAKHPGTAKIQDGEIVQIDPNYGIDGTPLTSNAKREVNGRKVVVGSLGIAADIVGFLPALSTARKIKSSLPYVFNSVSNDLEFQAFKKAYEINKLKKYHNTMSEFIREPITVKRLKNYGISEDVIKNIKIPKLTTEEYSGSYYNNLDNSINFDYKDVASLNNQGMALSSRSIYDHEFNHFLQKQITRGEDILQAQKDKNIAKYLQHTYHKNPRQFGNKSLAEVKNEFNVINHDNILFPHPTFDDDIAKNILPKFSMNPIARGNYNYFFKGSDGLESTAFIREMRGDMIDQKLINSHTSKVTPKVINKFFKKNPNNRIVSFMANTPDNMKDLKYLLNNIPTTVPVVGAALTLKNKKNR